MAEQSRKAASESVLSVQILRGVSALLIIWYHGQAMTNAAFGTSLHYEFGVFAVEIFFIISGFVMFYSSRSMTRSIGFFLLARLTRIVPLYWLATLTLVGAFVIGFRPVGLHVLNGPMIVQSLLFIPSVFPDGRHDLILSIGWTLTYELFFYACFALTFPLGSPLRSLGALGLLFGILTIVGANATGLPYLVAYFMRPIIFEFLFGGVLALLYMRFGRWRSRWRAPLGFAMLAAGIGINAALDHSGMPVPRADGIRFLIYGPPAMLVVGGALALERASTALPVRFALLLGAASYPLYLFHPMVLQSSIKIAAHVLPAGLVPGVAAILFAIVMSMVAAIVIHLVVERRIIALSKRLLRRIGTRSEQRAFATEQAAFPVIPDAVARKSA